MAGYAYVVNGALVEYPVLHARVRQLVPTVSFPENLTDEMVEPYGFLVVVDTPPPVGDVIVELDPAFDGLNWVQQWDVRDYTPEEKLESERPREIQARDVAAEMLFREQIAAKLDVVTDEELEVLTYLYSPWTADGVFALDALHRYEGVLYRAIQAHSGQVGWEPPNVPALWVRVRESGTEWFAGEVVTVGMVRTYQGTEYEVLQGHTTQLGWEPPNVPALWAAL